ncbi:MAG: alpha-galactosidase, partial [Pseudonocardiales bacterium]|nr:alpha-galactosidase [Pseudonocardiales bacterium]
MQQQRLLSLEVDARRARCYEEGWQSWSPSGVYPLLATPPRATSALNYRGNYGGTRPMPEPGTFSGEGLLALDPGTGEPIVVIGADDADDAVPRITARQSGTEVTIWADGPVSVTEHPAQAGVPAALAAFGDRFAARASVPPLRPAPTMWCSWY